MPDLPLLNPNKNGDSTKNHAGLHLSLVQLFVALYFLPFLHVRL